MALKFFPKKPLAAFQQIECKLYFNLQSDMVRFLADEQNSVDQNVKGKSHQQIIKSMRTGMQVISEKIM